MDHAFHLLIADPARPDFDEDLRALIAAGHRSVKLFTTYNIGLDDAAILHVLRIAGRGGRADLHPMPRMTRSSPRRARGCWP